ncbi:MAG: VWA domain-containing protein [Bdellovibrionales bacterium]|nr:VWA domain-containing protein [Bdellovibrionales bacterium]
MINKVLVAMTAIYLMGAGIYSVDNTVSIIQTPEGKYDVLCKDHTREVISREDLLNNNMCPHVAVQKEKKDILFVIDNSGSMQQIQLKLSSYAEEFIKNLQNQNLDFQIAVITTDNYKSRFTNNLQDSRFADGQILSSESDNLTYKFHDLLLRGNSGSGDERALDSIFQALENPLNKGFLRSDSQLEIIILGDEDDHSSSTINFSDDINSPDMIPVQFYTDYLYRITNSTINNYNYNVKIISVFNVECEDVIQQKVALRFIEFLDSIQNAKRINICDEEWNL